MTQKIFKVLFWAILVISIIGIFAWIAISSDDSLYLLRYIGNVAVACILILVASMEVWLFEKAYPEKAEKAFPPDDYDDD